MLVSGRPKTEPWLCRNQSCNIETGPVTGLLSLGLLICEVGVINDIAGLFGSLGDNIYGKHLVGSWALLVSFSSVEFSGQQLCGWTGRTAP